MTALFLLEHELHRIHLGYLAETLGDVLGNAGAVDVVVAPGALGLLAAELVGHVVQLVEREPHVVDQALVLLRRQRARTVARRELRPGALELAGGLLGLLGHELVEAAQLEVLLEHRVGLVLLNVRDGDELGVVDDAPEEREVRHADVPAAHQVAVNRAASLRAVLERVGHAVDVDAEQFGALLQLSE